MAGALSGARHRGVGGEEFSQIKAPILAEKAENPGGLGAETPTKEWRSHLMVRCPRFARTPPAACTPKQRNGAGSDYIRLPGTRRSGRGPPGNRGIRFR